MDKPRIAKDRNKDHDPRALAEARRAVRYYARKGEYPKSVSSAAWAILVSTDYTELTK